MRLSSDGGKTYGRRGERNITDELPNKPAAVLIYDNAGCARTLCVDLDTSKGGIAAVERDFSSLRAILSRIGARHFADRSPNGGIHVYVPLEQPVPYPEARAMAQAIASRTPTMDPMPMYGIDSGCIRPPGAWHKSTGGTAGNQRLIGSLTAAHAAVRLRNPREVWEALTAEIGGLDSAGVPTTQRPAIDNVEQLRPLGRHTQPDGRFQRTAVTGEYDTDRYNSPSEARQSVLWAAVASGWAFSDVARRVDDGTWPGLAGMYGRYRPNARHQAMVRDWKKAVHFEKHRRETTGRKAVRVGTTRGLDTHRAGVYQQIRTWINAYELACAGNSDDLATRAVLAALAEAAQKTGSMTIEFGNRSLAIASGLDQATVGKILKRLLTEADPLIDLVLPHAGIKANTFELTVPNSIEVAAQSKPWKKGKAHGIRGAFRELGLPAAFTYAALEQADEPLNGRDIAVNARLGVTATYEALAVLQAWGLATRTDAGWTIGPQSLGRLAESFGIVDKIKDQIDRYRAERRAYWAVLGIVRLVDAADNSVGRYDVDPPPPPDEGETCLDILENILGAHLIAEEPRQRTG